MSSEKPKSIHRKDYREPDYWIDAVDLDFALGEDETLVRARLQMRRNEAITGDPPPLELVGEALDCRGVWLDGEELARSAYHATPDGLRVERVPARFELQTLVALRPQENTSLSGLYRTSGNFCTQCEAMGFRRITYFLDRPDVMSRYSTTITGDPERYPVMLSNGNRVSEETLDDGRHRVRWEDPFLKPSYLFALVAGNLRCHSGSFVTRSGREVALEIWVEPQNIDRCEHALRSLQNAMRWDEEVFGLEYDLDIYMIVAVNDFNMGAMENKGLNVFNSKYVLAQPETATDEDYEGIEGVIGHEYFHNWTGNRVTCRDWFQLTLKEGLTVYRDQLFSADMTSAAVKRIDEVKILRVAQFAEDAGPMAHPIRPESYISMDNFYTSTVYNKGAEVIRMYEVLLGKQGFRTGMDLYFERHDGSAVTCDDFRAAMSDANDFDLDQFGRWYSQPGTPLVEGEGAWDADTGTYSLTLRQSYPETDYPDENGVDGPAERAPLHLPVRIALLGEGGVELPLRLEGQAGAELAPSAVIELKETEQVFRFVGLQERPIPSLFRDFSAPIRLKMERPNRDLAFLMSWDTDAFNRWDAGQELATRLLLELAAKAVEGETLALDPLFSESFGRVLADERLDGSLKALALTLPGEKVVGQEMKVIDPDALYGAREFMRAGLARSHRDALLETYRATESTEPYRNDKVSIDRRRLHNVALAYLACLGDADLDALVWAQFESADNMTDSQAALSLLVDHPGERCTEALERFYTRWRDDPLVLDKWFSVQALSRRPDALERVLALSEHADFSVKNPNRVRSLVGVFCSGNPVHFHRSDGAGYRFLSDMVIRLDPLNPQVAARMVSLFNQWRRFDAARQGLMRAELERIQQQPNPSKDVFEIVGRALAD
jgi:aminopeptidase N